MQKEIPNTNYNYCEHNHLSPNLNTHIACSYIAFIFSSLFQQNFHAYKGPTFYSTRV